MITVLIAGAVLAVCTAMRWYLDRPGRGDRECASGWVELTELYNEKGAFGVPLPKAVLTVLGTVCLGVLWLMRRQSPVGAGLVLGGGLSNLLERVKAGRVFDYLRFPKAPGKLRRYVYNLADLAVFLGGLFLLLNRRK